MEGMAPCCGGALRCGLLWRPPVRRVHGTVLLRLWRARVDAALQLGRPRARLRRVTGHSYSYNYNYSYQMQHSAQVPVGHTGTGAGAGACRARWDRRSGTGKHCAMLLAWLRRMRALLCLYSLQHAVLQVLHSVL